MLPPRLDRSHDIGGAPGPGRVEPVDRAPNRFLGCTNRRPQFDLPIDDLTDADGLNAELPQSICRKLLVALGNGHMERFVHHERILAGKSA